VRTSALLALLAPCLWSFAGTAQVLQPSIDLAKQGLRSPATLRNSEFEGAETTHLAVDSRGVVYVGFSAEKSSGLLQKGVGTGVYRVLGITTEGKIVRHLDYPMQSPYRVGINLNASDELLVTSNDAIRLVDSEGNIKNSFALTSYEHDTVAAWGVGSSSSGKTLLSSPDGFSEFTFLSAENLSTIAHCSGNREENIPRSFNDATEVATSNGAEHYIYHAELCGKTQLYHYSDGTYIVPILLTNGSTLELGESMLRLRTVSGDLLWRSNLPEHHRPVFNFQNEAAALTRSNNRFAVVMAEWSAGIAALDVSQKLKSETIQVYDTLSGKLIATLPLKELGCTFALNQDGTEVAILCGSSLEIWKL